MSASPRQHRSAPDLLALLSNQDFQRDAAKFHRSVAGFLATKPDQVDADAAVKLAAPFVARWGVPPPTSPELVNPDPRRRYVYAIASGRWGVVPIFPWTRQQELHAAIQRVRRKLGKEHQDRVAQQERVQKAAWLSACGIAGPQIAKAVWGRTRGLTRPKSHVTRISVGQEERLMKQFLAQGRTYAEAEALVLKRARGSEAPAKAAMRVADRRDLAERLELNAALDSPRDVDPRSRALTLLFRAGADAAPEAELRRQVEAVQQAFLTPSA